MSESVKKQRNWPFIIGVLFICVGLFVALKGFRFTPEEIEAAERQYQERNRA